MYILSASAVSPQVSFEQMLIQPTFCIGDRLQCAEPDYTKYIDAKLIRRMSRIVKMGVAAAMDALQQSGITNPDAIITGTAYGCLADTNAFLTRLVEYKEELLSPTAFIQSTHNTVGAQIALQLKCHQYNNTFVHRGSSFEAALMDAISLLRENEAGTVLVGAADEITEESHAILERFGLYKANGNSSELLISGTPGTMAGEGAAFFTLSRNKEKNAIAELVDLKTHHHPKRFVNDIINDFLTENNVSNDDLDLIILGNNGDISTDAHYLEMTKKLFRGKRLTGYKNYCGEYPTSSAFALWMAVKMIERGAFINGEPSPKKILIYNNYRLRYPSLYLVSAC